MSKFSFLRSRHHHERGRVVVDGVPPPVQAKVQSLGAGTLSADGSKLLEFVASPACKGGDASIDTPQTTTSSNWPVAPSVNDALDAGLARKASMLLSEKIMETTEKIKENIEQLPKIAVASFKRWNSTTFLRVADLQMTAPPQTMEGMDETERCPNFHTPSQDPPPGVDRDPQEEWVALDDGAGAAAPIAPYAVAALASFGYKTAMDTTMWKAEGRTERMLKTAGWNEIVWQTSGSIQGSPDLVKVDDVMVWTGNFIHGLYGSDLPAIRSAGIVNMSPKELLDLLVDSSRVKEYNHMSLGRTDLLVLQDNLHEEQADAGIFGKSCTKVMRAETQPPFIRKSLQFVSILHATALEDGAGYLIVTRAVTQASEIGVATTFDVLRSEILMGVNVIRKIEGHDNRCLMINVNHIRTPMVPLFVGKRLGLAAAPGFIRDLRSIKAPTEEYYDHNVKT